MSDAELVADALSGRREAFDTLARNYSRLVASIAMARLGRPGELEDVLQEVFTRAWVGLARLSDASKFSSWLYGITKWVCAEKIRDRRSLPVPLEDEERFAFPEPDERRADLLHAVEKLPEIYRETLMMLYFEEMSYEEIAGALGISKAAVNFRLTKARAMLRQELVKK